MAWAKQDLEWNDLDVDTLPAQLKADWAKVVSTLQAHNAALEPFKERFLAASDAPAGKVWRISVQRDTWDKSVVHCKVALADATTPRAKKSGVSFKAMSRK